MPDPSRPDRNLGLEIVRVTEAAALSSAQWQGRGEKESGDQAAVDAMRKMLSTVEMDGVVVIGEGEKDEAPMLFNGEQVGTGHPPEVDIAVDPVDGTRLLAEGRPGAIAVLAAAPRGSMFDPGPAVYMHKIVVDAEAAHVVDLDMPVPDLLRAIARAKRKRVGDLTVMMLDRPRHDEFKQQVRETGARLNLIMDGDVAGGISAAWASRPAVDLLYGIGGTPEGVTTACGVRALGGRILGRMWARDDRDRSELVNAGHDVDQVLDTTDLVSSDDCFLACTGITPSELLRGVAFDRDGAVTESLMMRGKSGTVRRVRAQHRIDKVESYGG